MAGNWILPNYANTDCWKDYEPGTILGKGTFGTTYLATKKGTNEKYAVKVGSQEDMMPIIILGPTKRMGTVHNLSAL